MNIARKLKIRYVQFMKSGLPSWVRYATLAALLVFAGPTAQAASSGSVFNAAVYMEETVGDLDHAIRLYQSIIREEESERNLAAMASLRLGKCLIKTGKRSEGIQMLDTLIKQYPEQTESVASARELLSLLVSTQPPPPQLEPCLEGELVFKGTYRHLWDGSDALFENRKLPDGGHCYMMKNARSTCKLVTDAQGRPTAYADYSGKYFADYQFASGKVVWTHMTREGGVTNTLFTPSPGALPDFNSRPDPYLVQNGLLKAYDFTKGGKQTFQVFDVDNTGMALSEYALAIELADSNGVQLTNGFFKARHLVQTQETHGGTWYKKRPGSVTDYWVDAEGTILRILRAREPYEVALTDYMPPEQRVSGPQTP